MIPAPSLAIGIFVRIGEPTGTLLADGPSLANCDNSALRNVAKTLYAHEN